MKRFLLDDRREIPHIHTHAKTAYEGVLALEKEYFDVYIFDHDLGEDITGLRVLEWALRSNLINPEGDIHLITSNPVGRKQMEDVLRDYNYNRSGTWWIK